MMIRILFVQANPPHTSRVQTDIEFRDTYTTLQTALQRERFELNLLSAARVADLQPALRRHRPHLLHFACHGEEDGSLLLHSPEDDQAQPLPPADLVGILQAHQAEVAETIQAIIYAGCYTSSTAEATVDLVDCCVGMSGEIDDYAVTRHFSPSFYAALGDGRSVSNSVASAVAELGAQDFGADAEMVRIFPADADCHLQGSTPLSSLHLDYLEHLLNETWTRVNLADISQSQKQASLLDIFVPLPVKFKLDIEVKERRIVDWQVHREGGNEKALPEAQRRGTEMNEEIAPERGWRDLNVGEAALQRIVDHFQATIDAENAQGRPTATRRTHTRTLEAQHAACLQPRFVLLGEPGGGKSSFLRHLALCMAGELRRRAQETDVHANASLSALDGWLEDAYTPLYIELRDLVATHFPSLDDDTKTDWIDIFWKYVTKIVLKRPGMSSFAAELRELCEADSVILLLDGLDEIPQAGKPARQAQIKAFVGGLVRNYSGMRIVVSSRPHAYRREEWELDGFGRTELDHLDWSRLSQLARAIFVEVYQIGDEASAFVQAIRDDPHIEPGLHRNPLFFTLLAALWLASPPNNRRLPTTRADLYRQATDLLLGRWTRRRAPDPSVIEQLGIPPEQLRPILESLACTITEQSAPGQDTTLFDAGLLDRILRKARLRVLPWDLSDYLTQHAGILVSPGPEAFAFVHRSFQEHLTACELTHARPDERRPPVAEERRFPAGLIQRVLDRPDLWENVVGLAADELLAQHRRDELIRLVIEMARPFYREKAKPETAFLALSIAQRLRLLDEELDEYDPRNLLRQIALAALTNVAFFEPERRLIAGQLLGSRPGLDIRPGVGVRADGLPHIDWVKIPQVDEEGRNEFIYQRDKRESPPDFWMARYPVTYAQFQCFIDASDGWRNADWWDGLALNDQDSPGEQAFPYWNYPREQVSWYQAIAFCRWLTAQVRQHPELLPEEMRGKADWRIALPTEWQWEKAARGYDGRHYPWGGEAYQPGYANINETSFNAGPHYLQSTSAVGMYPQGVSPYGLADMSGNVWEWCLNEYNNPEKIQESGSEARVLRGGGWGYDHLYTAAVSRYRYYPLNRSYSLGFRVVLCRSVPVPHL